MSPSQVSSCVCTRNFVLLSTNVLRLVNLSSTAQLKLLSSFKSPSERSSLVRAHFNIYFVNECASRQAQMYFLRKFLRGNPCLTRQPRPKSHTHLFSIKSIEQSSRNILQVKTVFEEEHSPKPRPRSVRLIVPHNQTVGLDWWNIICVKLTLSLTLVKQSKCVRESHTY